MVSSDVEERMPSALKAGRYGLNGGQARSQSPVRKSCAICDAAGMMKCS